MCEEMKIILEKTVRIAAAVCIAAGTVALAASGAALKVMVEGARCLKETVKEILAGKPAAGKIVQAAAQTQVRRQVPAAAEVVFLSET